MSLKNIANFLISAVGIVTVLILGKSLLIPFVFALLLWFSVKRVRAFVDKSKVIRNKFPSWLKSVTTSVLIIGVLGACSKVLTASIKTLAHSYKTYEDNADHLITQINELFGINILEYVQGHTGDIDFGSILSNVFTSISDILSNTFMILLYVVFIFLEEAYFSSKLKIIFSKGDRFEKISLTLSRVDTSIAKYLGIKTLVSLITGVLSFIILLFIGIDSPIFWAFLIFLLNFIPVIGSLIGTLFPAIFCLLQFGELSSGILVLSLVGGVQILVGNIIEPKLMGNSMNVSPLVVIISLSFWGAIWGITGMILCIPITVILIILFSQFPSTKSVAILLSEKGEIN
ncbi:MAG: AI-2E family transporter [Flavobacteriales bacterium]|nr:AI-2E family transporter [Flavobacteriales bacterium]